MKLIPLKELNCEILRNKIFLCYLPTEIVIPNRYDGSMDYRLNQAFYYRIHNNKDFPPKYEEEKFEDGKAYKCYHQPIAVEWWEDYGSDGHVEYSLQSYFLIMYENELELHNFDLDKYKELTSKAYKLRKEILNLEKNQMTFDKKYIDWGHYGCNQYSWSRY